MARPLGNSETVPEGWTLREALEATYRQRWAGTRSEKSLMSQATMAARTVAAHLPRHYHQDSLGDGLLPLVKVGAVTSDAIRSATAQWYAQGLAPATINKRLNCLSAMGISVQGCRVKEPKVLKWWLRPEMEKAAVLWLEGEPFKSAHVLASLVLWTTRTGLRIEESLRLRWSDFSRWTPPGQPSEVTVPGLKTGAAQATLALGSEAQALVRKRSPCHPDAPFPITYEEAKAGWNIVRREFGWENEPTATLKSLRRSAARYLHYDRGMPLDMVRQYLRHENIETTMGYLRLTGGVSLEEQRRYLG